MSSEGRGGATRNEQKPGAKVIPIYGRDEMNLCDIPYGPLTRGKSNTFQVNHTVFDRKRNRTVEKVLTITGSAAFGLPKPIDDQVLLGLKAITYNSGFQSRKSGLADTSCARYWAGGQTVGRTGGSRNHSTASLARR